MTHVLENKVLERRVAVCKINDCCPFRSNLCHVADGCHGLISDRSITGNDKDTNDKDFAMVTLDDETVFLVNGALTMFANSPSNAALLRDFDRGADMTKYIEQQLTYEPLPKGHKPARLKKALEAGEIML